MYYPRAALEALFPSVGEHRETEAEVHRLLRGIVTASDNILDGENKELLPLSLPVKGVRFKNIANLLLFERILIRVLEEALNGFDLLTRAGFVLHWGHAVPLIRLLFYVRGVDGLLPLLPTSGRMRDTLSGGVTIQNGFP